MISFYPGPSRVHDEVPAYITQAHKKGILSINHRSEEFMKISERTIQLLREKLDIPNDYTIFYTSSATECWEIIAQSLVTKKSLHLYSGSFGQKWFDYTNSICPEVKAFPFDKETALDPKQYSFDSGDDLICITQNETSNGTQVTNEIIESLQRNNPDKLLAVDVTSSMAGIQLNFKAADIWLASVQKCFGLPAGLGLMVCSPKAIAKAKTVGEKSHYNSLTFMIEMMEKWQTPFTPNVLDIYLLMRVMEKAKPIHEVEAKIKKRYNQWISFLSKSKAIRHLVENKAVHSYTVIPVAASPEIVSTIKKAAKKEGLLLGEGYGDLKASTFRIANFPALKKTEIEKLRTFLESFD
jgi:phosphoserine aminotransferase